MQPLISELFYNSTLNCWKSGLSFTSGPLMVQSPDAQFSLLIWDIPRLSWIRPNSKISFLLDWIWQEGLLATSAPDQADNGYEEADPWGPKLTELVGHPASKIQTQIWEETLNLKLFWICKACFCFGCEFILRFQNSWCHGSCRWTNDWPALKTRTFLDMMGNLILVIFDPRLSKRNQWTPSVSQLHVLFLMCDQRLSYLG